MRAVAAAGERALDYAGASLREMTRVAGANASVWSDIFVANGDLIADALAAHGAELEAIEQALRAGDRSFFERWIEEAARARSRMLVRPWPDASPSTSNPLPLSSTRRNRN